MKILISLLLLSILAIGCSEKIENKENNTASQFRYKYEQDANDPLNTLVYTLDNGLKVYMSINREEPRIQTSIAVRTGSKQDPSDATGLAHYLEHMLFKGTSKLGSLNWDAEKILLQQISDLYEKHRSTNDLKEKAKLYASIDSLSGVAATYVVPNEYDKLTSAMGAKGSNAYTSFEQTVYIGDIPSNEIEKWMMIESERFKELVLRLFHTELEAVYEEFNGGQDSDQMIAYETIFEKLFKKHTYGTQTTIGTGEHLKNPSMEKIHAYFNTYYVPNNMAIILAGDIDPDETIDLVTKYFGDYKHKEVPEFIAPVEDEITAPEEYEMTGEDAEFITLAYRMGGLHLKEKHLSDAVTKILFNGQAGLFDANLLMNQKVLDAYVFTEDNTDYSALIIQATPREGQKLEECKELLLAQIDKLKSGNFEEDLLKAVLKNFQLELQQGLEHNMARSFILSQVFISQQNTHDLANYFSALSKITKEEIVNYANKVFKENYVVLYKRNGKRETFKVEKPKINSVPLNRDTTSIFAQEIGKFKSNRLAPQFVNFEKDIQKGKLDNGIPVYFTSNAINQLFEMNVILEMGEFNDKEIALAVDFMNYLGTDKYTVSEFQEELYKLGLSVYFSAKEEQITISLSGLEESLADGLELLEHFVNDIKPEEEALKLMIEGIIKKRSDAKLNKDKIMQWLENYATYGSDSPLKYQLSEEELRKLTAVQLTDKIKNLFNYEHLISYYGRKSMEEVLNLLNKHHEVELPLIKIPEAHQFTQKDITENMVYFVNYNMVQAEILMIQKDEDFNPTNLGDIELFNNYFGGGMSSLVFQEIRESKALAYSAHSWMGTPTRKHESHYLQSYIGTQGDKMKESIVAMSNLINEMPVISTQFNDSKTAVLKKIETGRAKSRRIIWKYLYNTKLGVNQDFNEIIYPRIQEMELNDLIKFADNHVKNKKCTYVVIGNKTTLNMSYLKSLGTFKEVQLKEIFGY